MRGGRQILVLSCGSSSVKFGLFGTDRTVRRLASGAIERIGPPQGRLVVRAADGNAPLFTGGIGANAPPLREAICAGLDHLGIELDPRRNLAQNTTISPDGAWVKVQIVATDEERTIARHTHRVALEQRMPAHA